MTNGPGAEVESLPGLVDIPSNVIIAKVVCGDSSTAALTNDE